MRVQRVIDGDTIVVSADGDSERVRLLNIDAPGTKDATQASECLSEEAASYTESILKPGDLVTLEFDRERSDWYGRTLAHVKLQDGSYASDLIAAEGLGDAVGHGDDDARFELVKDALISASDGDRGLFDPSKECTLAALNEAATAQADLVVDMDEGVTAAEAATALAAVAAVEKSLTTLEKVVSDTSWIGRRVFLTAGRATEATAVSNARVTSSAIKSELEEVTASRKKIEAKEKAEAKRKAEAKKKAEMARKAEKAAQRIADARARQDAAEIPAPARKRSSGSGNPNSGYTGPRCYAPGGKTWKPC